MAKETELFLFGVIGDYPWNGEQTDNRDFSFYRRLQEAESQADIIRVRMNSPGGYVYDGMAIYNFIKDSKKEIHLYNYGLCASMAALILKAVPKERCHLARNSMTMFHCASTWGFGNSANFRETADYLDQVDETAKECLRSSSMDEETVESFFDGKDHYLTARQMHDMGLGICEDFEAKDVPNVEGKTLQQVALFYKPAPKAGLKDKIKGLFFINQSHKKHEVMSTKLKTLTFLAAAMSATEIEMSEGRVSMSMDEAIALNQKLSQMQELEKKVENLSKEKDNAEKKAKDLQTEITTLKSKLPGHRPTNASKVSDPQPDDNDGVVDMEDGHNQIAMENL
jgi:ATP-dependent protease ClpP protease subunit